MRQVQFAAVLAVAFAAMAMSVSSSLARPRLRPPAVAPFSGIQDRYCLQSRQWGYPGYCGFSTYAQCMATASGTEAGCGENPEYLFAERRRNYWPSR